jgi:hypothetical protein
MTDGQEIQDAYVVTPSDTVEQNFAALFIGVAGHVSIVTRSNRTVQFTNVPIGILRVSGKRVMATGTAATGIVALV